MAFSVVPFALQNGSHSADLFRQATSSFVPPGGGIVTTGDLAVSQTGTPSMNVSIGVGRVWIPGTNVGNVSGGNFSSQAMYYGQNESAYTASVATSDPINPRIDVVYAAVQDSQYSGASNAGVLATVTGVPTSGAAYPANAPAIPANAKALAYVTVAANATSIVNANITSLLGIGISPNLNAKGLVYQAVVTAGSGGFTGLTVVNNIASFTFKAGRRYEITWDGHHQSSADGDYIDMQIATCAVGDSASLTTGLTPLRQKTFRCVGTSLLTPDYIKAPAYFTSDTTVQIKFAAARASGSGTLSLVGSALDTITYQIHDVGAQI